ncbi:hypothetical protein AVEN_106624-1 [Araneus ventricosus]|uniref:Uncharacterized protein n=1 Tax=Araneus ventricosus TaxID=182803 RepID=A0A4Y2I411_ARAVE|nr:hypothetical protein AVEN_106624-1 [Araneus ventricosus]
MICDADRTGTKKLNLRHATPTVRAQKSGTYGMRRRPYGHKKAELMTCDADRTGTKKLELLEVQRRRRAQKKLNLYSRRRPYGPKKAEHHVRDVRHKSRTYKCDADRTGTEN